MSGLSVAKLRRMRRRGRRYTPSIDPTTLSDMLTYDLLIDALASRSGIPRETLIRDRGCALDALYRCYGDNRAFNQLADIFGVPDAYYTPLSRPSGPSRPPIPLSLRMLIYKRDGFACVACGVSGPLSLDHIMPYSRGGPDTEENLRCLCRRCNSIKHAKTPEECGF